MMVNFKLWEETRNDVINMSPARDWKFIAENFGRNE